jgi:hypothetical protein
MDVKEDTTSPVLVSVFSNRIVVPVFYGVITSILLPATVWYALTSNDVFDIIGGIIAFLVIALIWLVIVGGELRLKTHRIYFKANNIEVRSFFGLGKKQTYAYNTISECTIGLQPAYPFPYECITLISNQKEILRISQFYFRNYLEMKLLVIDTFKEYKIIKFSLKKYILEIFKS